MDIGKINLNGINYLKESDVDKFYTRKDHVVIDEMVLEKTLLKLEPSELVRILTSVAEDKLREVNYAELSEMMKPENKEEYAINMLLMISNVGQMI
ncbi:hypothetical protein [Paenibacillus polymyxa]|uniref:Uncharacterized protein n=1 Tax=Paenibacillus polymyxa (strain SC2) TaxID=886882 RepID=E3EL71_PAEPS|nr:hypothetical protein [Paenibacillus polymyxa]ADO59633.1 hypothetical protein PPSC2_26970 [Paenibacillus polymyxa SC2]WPQ59541.1 hypothetical protein SKN87_28165 [Paenibacillus polymyxa]